MTGYSYNPESLVVSTEPMKFWHNFLALPLVFGSFLLGTILVLIGAGANRKRIGTALLDFLNKTKIPFFSTQMGKGVIDERHNLNLGTAALSKDDYIHCAIDYADLIINVGSWYYWETTIFYGVRW